MNENLAATYGIPSEFMALIADGLLQVLSQNEAERTVEFHVPSRRSTDTEGRITTYSLVWIHPDFNEQFCRYYLETPGDLANFYVFKDTTDLGEEQVDLNSVDELLVWLEQLRVGD